MHLNPSHLREQFPALQQRDAQGRPAIYFDGPGGTQVPQRVVDAMSKYLTAHNANTHGAFVTSTRTDEMLQATRAAMADFINATPGEIVFGANMTTLTFHVSRSLGRDWQEGDEIIVTRLDHDANVSPWLALQEKGVKIRFLDFKPEDCTLDYDSFDRLLSNRVKLVAVGLASNAVGTINDVARFIQKAHAGGALVYVDAVHYAPHAPIDVQALDCDFLVCSAYKFFGPHVGVLYGRREILEKLQAYKVRPQEMAPPFKFETGTLNHEGLAGTHAAIEYLADLGKNFAGEYAGAFRGFGGRKLHLKCAMAAIQGYERKLSETLLAGLQAIPGLKVYGITAPSRFHQRTPTVALRMQKYSPRALAERLAAENIYVWDGNFYALEVTTRLGVEEQGGVVRVGLVHYNTMEEIDRMLNLLQTLS
jgi:cysteine desulfurase family protein (TIGR01976 family)